MIEIKKEKNFFDTIKFYFDMRMLKILLLGAISGFPWVKKKVYQDPLLDGLD